VTIEVERKLVPLMVSVCAAAPAVAEEGERLVMAGTGLLAVTVTVGEPAFKLAALPVVPSFEAVVNVLVPAVVGAVAFEYVNVKVLVPAQVWFMVIRVPEVDLRFALQLPAETLTKPAPDELELWGADHPDGTATVTIEPGSKSCPLFCSP
jgi:hypothetical protein